MDVAYISALSALAGSVIGGVTSTSMTWFTQLARTRSEQRSQAFARREELYREFIVAASTAYGEALVSSEPQIQKLVALYSMISRMRVLSAPITAACADKVMLIIIDTYFKPNRSLRELRDLLKDGNGAAFDPLKDFSEAARAELGMASLQ
jgi:hypothetical protein